MNRKQFLNELERLLSSLPKEEREDILTDYNEYFANGLTEGKSEEEIVEKLGSPIIIAKELGVNSGLDLSDNTTKNSSSFGSIVATIALGFFNLVFILGPAIGLIGVLFGGWVAGICLTAAPLLQVLSLVLGFNDYYLFEFFVAIACSGLGIFLLVGMYHLSKIVSKGFKMYYRWNISIVKGGINHA